MSQKLIEHTSYLEDSTISDGCIIDSTAEGTVR